MLDTEVVHLKTPDSELNEVDELGPGLDDFTYLGEEPGGDVVLHEEGYSIAMYYTA